MYVTSKMKNENQSGENLSVSVNHVTSAKVCMLIPINLFFNHFLRQWDIKYAYKYG